MLWFVGHCEIASLVCISESTPCWRYICNKEEERKKITESASSGS
jgi:hypothetical protein